MNWRATALVLLVVGAALGVGGIIWRNQLHGDAHECRIRNLGPGRNVDCATTTPGLVVALVGAGLLVLAVALLAGTVSRGARR
jgi:hypothetical protein